MNRLSYALAAAALFVTLVPSAAATSPDLPPLVGYCVDGVHEGCWGSDIVCVGISYQMPQCVEEPRGIPDVECARSVCDPCYSLVDCDPIPVIGGGTSSGPMCMYYYYEIDTGVVRYVQRDSCHSEIYVLGQRVK